MGGVMDRNLQYMKRKELIEIIIQYKQKEEQATAEHRRRETELEMEIDSLREKLQSRRLEVEETGNLANATLELHGVFEAAQEAADHYVEEMKARMDDSGREAEKIVAEAQSEAKAIRDQAAQFSTSRLQKANTEAEKIRAQAAAENEKLKSQALKSVQEAQEEAGRILARANSEAEQLKAKTAEECEQMKVSARQICEEHVARMMDQLVNIQLQNNSLTNMDEKAVQDPAAALSR